MSSEKPPKFLRRINEYGAFESACAVCFDVISTQIHEADLTADEASHLCNDMILNEALDYFRSYPIPETRSSKR